MPLTPPLAEILRKVKPLAPIVVFATFSAVPVGVVSVLTIVVLFCVTLTVPPPVAVKAGFAPVLSATPPVKLIVAPVLLVRLTPRLLVEDAFATGMPPENETLPPVLPETFTASAVEFVMVPL